MNKDESKSSSGKATHSIYPLDKNRKLLSETVDENGVKRKVFRVFAENGDFVDFEMEEHLPKPQFRPIDAKWSVIAQEQDAEGYLHKLMLATDKGITKEFYLTEKIPEGGKRKAEDENVNSNKKIRATGAIEYITNDAFTKLLLRTKVEELQTDKNGIHIYVAYRSHPAKDVFHGLINQGFLSCPVLNKDGLTYHAFIDMLDFINYFVGEFGAGGKNTLTVMDHQQAFKDKKVKEIIRSPLKKRNPFHPFLKGYSLFSVMEVLAIEGLRHVPIVEENGKLINMITQSQLVEFVFKNMKFLGSIKERKVNTINHVMHKVESVKKTELAVTAFKKIVDHNFTGVAVVDDNTSELVGNISARDFKAIDVDGKWWSRLFLTAESFVHNLPADLQTVRPKNPIFVLPEDTLESVITKIHDNKIHRVFIVDDATHKIPVGIITLRDILKEIIDHV